MIRTEANWLGRIWYPAGLIPTKLIKTIEMTVKTKTASETTLLCSRYSSRSEADPVRRLRLRRFMPIADLVDLSGFAMEIGQDFPSKASAMSFGAFRAGVESVVGVDDPLDKGVANDV